MYVEYDSVRDFFFLAPPAFLGAFADFLEGVLAICVLCVSDVLEREGSPIASAHFH